MDTFLIVGLGNPGEEYHKTRHNAGFMVVDALSKKLKAPLKRRFKLRAKVGEALWDGKKVILAQPLTYMNLSGNAVIRLLEAFDVPVSHLLVISDDVAIDFGMLRLRKKGSSGGQKGLKHIEERLQTMDYSRLRLGVGEPEEGDLADYVLDRFNDDELKKLPEIIDRAIALIGEHLEETYEN